MSDIPPEPIWALAGGSVKAGRKAAPRGVALREARAGSMIDGEAGSRRWGNERAALALSATPVSLSRLQGRARRRCYFFARKVQQCALQLSPIVQFGGCIRRPT
jgi:hypothetical protein